MRSFILRFPLILAMVHGLYIGPNESNLCETNDRKMRNIGYVLSGYDIWFGNPLATGNQLVDPGFRRQIFAATYTNSLTADNRYCVPGLKYKTSKTTFNNDQPRSGKEKDLWQTLNVLWFPR